VAAPVKILVLSTSHRGASKSEYVALRCQEVLQELGAEVNLVTLKDHEFPPLVVDTIAESVAYKALHPLVSEADGLILTSPVYNWSLSGALKEFIEHVGSTDNNLRAALFDKVVTFAVVGGLPHGYMAFGPTALSLMLDFRCVINPYQVFVYDKCWDDGSLTSETENQLRKSMSVMLEMTALLKGRSYSSNWSV